METGLLIVLIVGVLVIVALQLRSQSLLSKKDTGRELEELQRLQTAIAELERRFTDTFLRDIGDVREKFTQALGDVKSETSNNVHTSLATLAETLTQRLNEAKTGMAGADKNMQDRFDQLRLQVNETISGTTTQIDARMKTTTQALQERIDAMTAGLDKRMGDLRTNLNEQLGTNQKTLETLQTRLAELKSASDRMIEIGDDIKKLEEILAAPKRAGGLGETLLENLLRDILPREKWKTQLDIPNGGRVDAAIFLPDGILPIDSKFPVDVYSKVVAADSEKAKKDALRAFADSVRIKIDEVAKYIQPEHGTLNMAMMYVPSESLYYEITTNKDIADGEKGISSYARAKRVVILGPQMFFAYLESVLLGFKGQRIQENARKIIAGLESLNHALEQVMSSYDTASKQLRFTTNNFDQVKNNLDKMESTLRNVESLGEVEE